MSRLRASLAALLVALAARSGDAAAAEPNADGANESPLFLNVVEVKPTPDGKLRLEVCVLNNGETSIMIHQELERSLYQSYVHRSPPIPNRTIEIPGFRQPMVLAGSRETFWSASSLVGPLTSQCGPSRDLVALEPGRSMRLSTVVERVRDGAELDRASMTLEYGTSLDDFRIENRSKRKKAPALELWIRQP
jgi:hypothetical protein